MSEATTEPIKRGQDEILRDVQAVLREMTAKNWRDKKAALLAKLAKEICP
jgi:hypothetical protein